MARVLEVLWVPFFGRMAIGFVLGLLAGALVARAVRELRSR